jgi:1,4-alpha-glucan branching enzyme
VPTDGKKRSSKGRRNERTRTNRTIKVISSQRTGTNCMAKGYLSLLLHAHLPFVRHPEHDDFLEENWLYEAITETYIPLIKVFAGLTKDNIPYRITLSLTPTLITMLDDELLQSRYITHLHKLIELAEKEMVRNRRRPQFFKLASMYHKQLVEAHTIFVSKYKHNLIVAFKEFQKKGRLEIITCPATHAYLPLIRVNPSAVKAQICTAVEHYQSVFEEKPKGMWLPECGYYPGLEELLREVGIRYFVLDTHGILNAEPKPRYGTYAPLYTPNGTAAFGRDHESSKQVWSSIEGYPGDYDYREFYRDIGYDLDFEYIKPYIHKDGIRINTGIKYYRITGKTDHKEPYVPEWALEKASLHAGNFMFNREKQIEHFCSQMERPPLLVAPYDAELFGHWWFEGPQWINFLIRKIAYDQNTIELITPHDYLERHPINQTCRPSAGSWGYKGYNEMWLNGSNDWIYPLLHRAADRMASLARTHRGANGVVGRALNQAARELLLAQSSDWAFIMKTSTAVEYAVKRTNDHLLRFNKLSQDVISGNIDLAWLKEIEMRDNIFPQINFEIFC